jgi:hypothetical protein
MNTEELRAALRGATEELATAPTFAGEVMRGGARRVRRRRLIAAGVAAATALAAGGTAIIGWQSVSEPAQQIATDPRLSEPPKGSLSLNSEFVREALRAWQEGLPKEPMAGAGVTERLIGQPHVYWADTIPGDQVAVVIQAMASAWEPGKQDILRGVIGTRPGTQSFGIVALWPPTSADGHEPAFRIGPGGRNVLAMETQQPQYLSAKVTYDNENRPKRDWQQMESRYGVVLGQLPDGVGVLDPAVVIGDPANARPEDQVQIVSGVGLTAGPEQEQPNGLPWGEPGGQSHMMWAGTEPGRWRDMSVMRARFHDVVRISPYVDRFSFHHDDPSPWYLSVGLPGGKIATVAEYQAPYDQRARIYMVSSDSADGSRLPGGGISFAGPADPAKPLPVLAKLPDNTGWAAAAKGATLSYRTTKDGLWQGGRAEALLVPAGAVQIQVARPGQQAATVDIP